MRGRETQGRRWREGWEREERRGVVGEGRGRDRGRKRVRREEADLLR